MNNNLSRLETLPNEIFIDTFQFLDAPDLFRAFYNLNTRFNELLHSFDDLSLTLSTNHSNEYDFLRYIRILLIDRAIDININRFTRVRCLILRYPTDKLLVQLNGNTLPHLTHLGMNHMHISVLNRIPDLCDKIFSNDFPNLISCYLFQWWVITRTQRWTQSASLRILKVGKIDLLVYKVILNSCPNLYFLQFSTITSNDTPCDVAKHVNLKRMRIKPQAFIQPWTDDDVKSCLVYVPNLEYFSVHRTDRMGIPKHDWLASIIDRHLPHLRQFDFYFHIFNTSVRNQPNMGLILNEIKKRFKTVHHSRYQSRFIINRVQLF